jgi:hypothetical protein
VFGIQVLDLLQLLFLDQVSLVLFLIYHVIKLQVLFTQLQFLGKLVVYKLLEY